MGVEKVVILVINRDDDTFVKLKKNSGDDAAGILGELAPGNIASEGEGNQLQYDNSTNI